MSRAPASRAVSLLVLSAGVSTPSSSRQLADLLAGAVRGALGREGLDVAVRTIDLRDLAHDATDMLLTRTATPALQDAAESVREADAIIAVTPIFNTGPSGLAKTFVDALDPALWRGTPVLLGATAGSTRHALALEYSIRPIFVALRAQAVPTAVFATSVELAAARTARPGVRDEIGERADRAADELAALLASHDAQQARR